MKLIVGLGNPGRKYEGTRHNIGFDVVDAFARACSAGGARNRFQGEVIELNWEGKVGEPAERLLLLRPQTYMNLSGQSVVEAKDFYKINPSDILVVCDDFSLLLGRLRFRARGSSGGQKGLADILLRLGTEAIPRLRIGIGTPPPQWDPADFVLSRFAEGEKSAAKTAILQAVAGVQDWVRHGIAYCMNQYNREKKTE
jgi:peptidyl-tRNA hydrolase, PTH1 family